MSSDHWPQFYQQSPPTIYSVAGDSVSDSTVVTTSSGPTAATTGHHLTIPEGRVAKPIRRRSRASRRTPTTLLNTDTTNFRAMVQQFTGGPSAPYGTASSQINTHSFSFAMNSNNNNNNNNTNPRQGHVINPGGVMINPNSGFHIQYQNQQQQQSQVQQQNPYMFSLGANSSSSSTGQGDIHRDFFQRISSGTAEEGVPAERAPPSSENRSNSFLF